MTHTNENNQETQGTGYIGIESINGIIADRDQNSIPKVFLRKEIGTSIFIPAVNFSSSFKEDIIRAILENFLASIYKNKIVFYVEDEEISKNTIESIFAKYKFENCDVENFLNCYSKSEFHFEESLDNTLGKCTLDLSFGDYRTRKVILSRETGMSIMHIKPLSTKFYVGIFQCLSDEGNKVLRSMEPPSHDKWDPNRHEDPKIGRKIMKTIRDWIRMKIQSSIVHSNTDEFNLDEAAEYFPLNDKNDNENSGNETAENNNTDAFTQTAKLSESKIVSRIRSSSSNGTSQAEKFDSNGENLSGYDPSGKNSEPANNKGNSYSGVNASSKNDHAGRQIPLTARMISSSDNENIFCIRSESDFCGEIAFAIAGIESDDNTNVKTAKNISSGNSFEIRNGKITGVEIKAGEMLKISVTFSEKERNSLKIKGYESDR